MAEHLKQIGSVDKLAGSVSVRHPDGSQSTLQAGSPVYQGDQVETAADGRVGIVFVDKSTFSLGPKGRMTMDEMVFDPAHPQDGHATVAALNGAFSYVSGQIAKSAPESMQIKTPVMTIGVRGTTVAGMAAAEGSANTVTLMRDGSGQLGQIVITTAAGSVVLNGESHTIQISSFIQPPPAPTALSAAAISALYGNALSAQPQPPSAPPETPPNPGTPNGQGGQGGQLQAPDGHAQQVTLDNPANAEQVAQFVTSVLNQIQNPDVVQDVLAMLGDLSLWTFLAFEGESRSLNEILADMEMTDQEFWALVEADAENDDYFDDNYDDTGDEDFAFDDQPIGDEIFGGNGNDVLYGTPYGDTIWGMGGNDTLYGDDGDDTLDGGQGADTLYGEGGDDLFVANPDSASDTFDGGVGNDTISFDGGSMPVNITLDADGNASLYEGGGYDYYYSIENIIGSDLGDRLRGNDNANSLSGGYGNDTLYGKGGDDTLSGGDGADQFWLQDLPGAGCDLVTDFEAGVDKVIIAATPYYGLTVLSDTSNAGVAATANGTDAIVLEDQGGDVGVYYYSVAADQSYQIATLANVTLDEVTPGTDVYTASPP